MKPRKIGFYPIVDSYEWAEKLIPLGVPSLQLRIKNKPLEIVEHEILKTIDLSQRYTCQLFINDYWQLAIKHHAFGLHLGQEDIEKADIRAIHNAGLYLGISTHNHQEIERALSCDPFYLAYGPIYETTTKKMSVSPRGLSRLKYWVDMLNFPIVAIGGISLTNLDDVLETDVDGIAVISAITTNPDYQNTIKKFNAAVLYDTYEEEL